MRVQLRIVAGDLRGRRIACSVNPKRGVRPTPDRVRESLFNILGDAVVDRPFFDVFAGSGVMGLEAISRGASCALFVERDLRLAQEIEKHAREFGVSDRTRIVRVDAYRWAALWEVPNQSVIVFVSPPFADIEKRTDDLLALLGSLADKSPSGSMVVFQTEQHSALNGHPALAGWEQRRYGRNTLLLHRCGNEPAAEPAL